MALLSFLSKLGRHASALWSFVATLAARAVQAGTSFLLVPILAAIAIGSSAWFVVHEKQGYFDTNKIPWKEQSVLGTWVAATLGAVLLVIALVAGWNRWRRGRFGWVAASDRVGGFLWAAWSAPFIAFLVRPNVEKESPKLCLVAAFIAAITIGISVYRVSRDPVDAATTDDAARSFWRRNEAKLAPWLAGFAVLLLWAAYSAFFARLSIVNHHALTTRTTDLGYYDNIFWQSIHGNPLGCTFIKAGYHGSAHFDPILVILSPLYLLYPRAEFLLGLQSIWLGSGVIPVYLVSYHHLKRRPLALALAATYALHPALHGANMYEFHSLTLATVPVLWVLYMFEAGHRRLYWVTLFVALLVREDVALLMCFVGAYQLVAFKNRSTVIGLGTIAASIAYFVIVKAFFMTSSGVLMTGPEAYSFAYYYDELIPSGKGTGGLVLSLLTNPAFLLNHILEEPKIVFVVTVFLPLLFLPLFARRGRMMLLYGLMFTLLASRGAVYSVYFQYTAALLPIAFALAPVGVKDIAASRFAQAYGFSRFRLERALVLATLVSSILVTYKFGGLWDNTQFKGGFYRVVRKLTPDLRTQHDWIEQMQKKIPENASVGVTNKLGPHVSNRRHAYFYGTRRPQFIFVDEKELKGPRVAAHKKAIAEGRLVELGRHGTLALFRATNAENMGGAGEWADTDLNDVLGDKPQE